LAKYLPGYFIVALKGWDDFVLCDRKGQYFLVSTVPLERGTLAPFQFSAASARLEFDERFRGKIKWYVKPIRFAGEMAFHAGARPYQMLPLLIPVLVVAAQVFYPTLLGWAFIFIPSVAYCCIGLYYLIRIAAEKPPQWEHDLEGFVVGLFFVGMYLFASVCFLLARCGHPEGLPNPSVS